MLSVGIGVSVYRQLLRLYPAIHREQFADEMMAVFADVEADGLSKGKLARGVFWTREIAGIVGGILHEHWRALGGDSVGLCFPTRRFTMRTEFRFPKTTAALMTIILAGVVLAIKKGETISSSPVNPPIGPLPPTHSVLLGGIFLTLAFFYAAGMIGWAILFAMRRSGVHRLAETAGGPR
jgi:hypothetical protein